MDLELEPEDSIVDACTVYSSYKEFVSKRGSVDRPETGGKRTNKAGCGVGRGMEPAETPMGHFVATDKLPEESEGSLTRRRLAYEQAVRVLGECVETISVATHEGVFREAASFLTARCESPSMSDDKSVSKEPVTPEAVTYGPESLRLVPAVVMYAGLNLSDQEALFAQLTTYLRSNCTSNIVAVSSKDVADLDATMARIIAACKLTAAECVARSLESAAPPTPSRKLSRPKPNAMKSKLRSVVAAAQRKRANTASEQGKDVEPVAGACFPVIVFADAQDVPSSALETIILALSHLPVQCGIVFGVCSTVEGFRSQLSLSAASRLWIHPLFMKNPVVFVDALLETLCARSSLRVQIGLKPLQWLTQHMLKSNMSTQATVQALRVCLLQYYNSNPLSLLALPSAFVTHMPASETGSPSTADPALWNACHHLVATLPEATLEYALTLPSVTPGVTSLLGKKPTQQTKRKVVCSWFYGLEVHRLLWTSALACAQSALQGFQHDEGPGDVEEKLELDRIQAYSLRKLHLDALEAAATGSSPTGFVSTACQRIKEVPVEALRTMVLSWQDVLMSCKDSSGLVDSEIVLSIAPDDSLSQLDAVIEAVDRAILVPTATRSTTPASPSAAVAPQRSNAGGAYGGLKKRAAVLQTVTEPRVDKDPLWFARDLAAKWLQSFTVKALSSVTRLPMHEALWFDHVTSVKKWFAPAPRVSVIQALAQPSSYLPTATATQVPDICRAYEFYHNADRLIDLYEWYTAFKGSIVGYIEPASSSSGAVSGSNGRKTGRGKRKSTPVSVAKSISEEAERVIQARFLTATKQLTWMGFLKPVGRRQDVVARTVFGMDTWSS